MVVYPSCPLLLIKMPSLNIIYAMATISTSLSVNLKTLAYWVKLQQASSDGLILDISYSGSTCPSLKADQMKLTSRH